MRLSRPSAFLALAFLVAASLATAADEPMRDVKGQWAMSWQTHSHGIRRSGYLVIKQNASKLDVTLTGDGELHASGVLRGDAFHIEGRRMLMRYTIDGTLDAQNVMHGILKMPGLEKPFSATREP